MPSLPHIRTLTNLASSLPPPLLSRASRHAPSFAITQPTAYDTPNLLFRCMPTRCTRCAVPLHARTLHAMCCSAACPCAACDVLFRCMPIRCMRCAVPLHAYTLHVMCCSAACLYAACDVLFRCLPMCRM